MGKEKRSTVLGRWDVPSSVVVRQDALKWGCATWSWELPRGRARLFTPGRLAPPPSSSLLFWSARALDWPAMLRPKLRPELVVGGA
jgi:hypothetical protein